jgi:hypothetical protein
VALGSYVQWTSQGVDQFAAPKRVDSYADETREWVFLEGEETAVSVTELTVVDIPDADHLEVPVAKIPPKRTLVPASPPKKNGPCISFPLTGSNVVEIRLDALISDKDFDRLKALLDLSKDSLVEPGS